jgi:hypothetical protein
MVKKKKRGRPVGPFGRRGSVMGLRLPTELRELLEQAAAESGRTISGELLWRLNLTFRGHERSESMAQAMTATEKAVSEARESVMRVVHALEQASARRKR